MIFPRKYTSTLKSEYDKKVLALSTGTRNSFSSQSIVTTKI